MLDILANVSSGGDREVAELDAEIEELSKEEAMLEIREAQIVQFFCEHEGLIYFGDVEAEDVGPQQSMIAAKSIEAQMMQCKLDGNALLS
eukprot:7011103-Prymnesium_polylepis.2